MFDCVLLSSLPPVFFLQSLTVSSSCIWWWGCLGCESLWCSWLWGNIRPPGRSRTCAAEWTRWFWFGRKRSSPRCNDGDLKRRKQRSPLSTDKILMIEICLRDCIIVKNEQKWKISFSFLRWKWVCSTKTTEKSNICSQAWYGNQHLTGDCIYKISDFSYRLQMAHRQTSPLQRGCLGGSGQGWTPSSPPRCRAGGGWQSGRRRPGGPQGWCILLRSEGTKERETNWNSGEKKYF